MNYLFSENRYDNMQYRYCGKSGLKIPVISLGLWHNFGGVDIFENSRGMILHAFDLGITHIDLANNYGTPPGSAEEVFGKVLKQDLQAHRDELIISSKAGYLMWPGPYGEWGSRKYLVASCDQSLKRIGVDYLDIFYSHRPDPNTPLEETMGALDYIVRSGKSLYCGISSYNPKQTKLAVNILKKLGTPCLVHQPKYNMFEREIETGLLDVIEQEGIGCVVFSPLAQGLLTDKYLKGIPVGSRAAKPHGFLKSSDITNEKLAKIKKLDELAKNRNQSMAQLALSWILRKKMVTSVIIGASNITQIDDAFNIMQKLNFTDDELKKIDLILVDKC
jgi:L-glyceraldehyde 3-phosphate reductase